MRKSLIITVVIVLLCLCGCEAVVTVPESPEPTKASEMLLTTTAAEESTGKLEATTTSSVEIDVPEKNEEESGTPTEDVVSVDNKADLAEKNGLVSSESTVPSFEEVKADKPSEQTETQLSAPSEPPRETEQSKPTEQPVATEPDEAPAEPPAPTEPTAITEPPIPSETEPPVETQPKTAYDYEFDINAIRSDCIAIGQGMGYTLNKKKELFGKVRSGQIRVLLGSTQKMGAGTNVQTKLVALHHLDCPWRPSDLQQREGRIIRQGNENPEVDIYTYVTENTFDSYLYQLVEGKQKFIG